MVGLLIGVIVLLVLLFVLFAVSVKGADMLTLFAFALLLYSAVLALFISETMKSFESKYKKTPTIKVECLGNKCDTTYIYKF